MLAMLCKTSTARRVCVQLQKAKHHASCVMRHFDSKAVFDISAAACLLICDFRSAAAH